MYRSKKWAVCSTYFFVIFSQLVLVGCSDNSKSLSTSNATNSDSLDSNIENLQVVGVTFKSDQTQFEVGNTLSASITLSSQISSNSIKSQTSDNASLLEDTTSSSENSSIHLNFLMGSEEKIMNCQLEASPSNIINCSYKIQVGDKSGALSFVSLDLQLVDESTVLFVIPKDDTKAPIDLKIIKTVRISDITLTNAKDSYITGDKLTLKITFSDSIALSGSATLAFALGAVQREAICASDATTATILNCNYTIQTGDASATLAFKADGLIASKIEDSSGKSASLSIPTLKHPLSIVIKTENPISQLQVAASVSVTSNDNQTGVVATALSLPFIATIKDANGNPVSGVAVTWSVVTGGGSFASSNAVSTNDGTVSSPIFTLGNIVGSSTVKVAVTGSALQATFSVSAIAGAAASIEVSANDNQSAVAGNALPHEFVALIKDSYGNVVAGANVTWVITSSGGSLSLTSSISDSNGLITGPILTLAATAGANTVKVSLNSDPTVNLIFTAQGILQYEMSSDWAPQWDHLVGYWKFNETAADTVAGGSADFLDSSPGGGYDGSTPYTIQNYSGKINTAARFIPWFSTYVSMPLLSTATNNITMSAWFKSQNYTEPGQMIFYNGSPVAGDGYGVKLNSDGEHNGHLRIVFGGVTLWNTNVFITDNNWHQVVLVLESNGSPSLYLDGSLVFSSSGSVAVTPTLQALIGMDENYFMQDLIGFYGYIDEAAFWSVPLQAADVHLLYLHATTGKH